ncbi:hypothetical protein COZ13_02430, partial [Candidatus Desantisbacteria bacterium CG_4_10_14_3_um_filter_40_18]
MSPTAGTVGTVIMIDGTGYAAGDSIIIVAFGTSNNVKETKASQYGSWTTSFTANAQSYGTTTITATGASSESAQNQFFMNGRIIGIYPTSGAIGLLVSIKGDGYRAGETVIINFEEVGIATATVAASGTFTASFAIPDDSVGTKMVTASDGVVVNTISFTIKAGISDLSPNRGSVGTVVYIAGNGYGGTETIRVDFGNTSSIAVTMTSGAGTFSTTFTINTQPAGQTTVIAEGVNSHSTDLKTFTVWQHILSITPAKGTVGSMITITADGYGSSEVVRIQLGTSPSVGSVVSSDMGTFTAIFSIDTQAYGTRTIVPIGQVSFVIGVDTTTCFVLPEVYSISPKAGTVGRLVEVQGTGYVAGATITLTFGSSTFIASQLVETSGHFVANFVVDLQPYGTTTVKAVGVSEAAENTFMIMPAIYYVSPSMGTVGTIITINCRGFVANDSISISFGSNATIQQAAVDNKGYFATTFTIDVQHYGTTTIKASGSMNTVAENTTFILPNIYYISNKEGTVGAPIVIRGRGFAPGEIIKITIGTWDPYAEADENGYFEYSFTIDTQSYGTTTINATGSNSTTPAEETFNINPELYFVSPMAGTVGTVVYIHGTGYAATELITIAFGNNPSIQITMTDDIGFFDTTFTIDTQVYGTTTITAIGALSGSASNTSFIQPEVYLVSPTKGSVGTVVMIRGTGYATLDGITVAFGTNASITTTVASSNGSFTATFTVDTQSFGTTTIMVSGVSVATNSFHILPQVVSVSPTAGTVGTMVTISGTGYGVTDTLTVAFGTNATIQQAAASEYGSWTAAWTVDTQVYGTTTITVSGVSSAANRFFIQPEVYMVTPTMGSVGTLVSVGGTGYAVEAVTIDFGTHNNIKIQSTNDMGWFNTTFTIDVQAYGTTTITARGVSSATNVFYILPEVVSVQPTSGSVGTIVTIRGTGYGATDGITVAFGGNPTIQQATASTHGSFTSTWTVDTQGYGTTTITVSGVSVATNRFFILPQVYSVIPTSGTVGTVVSVAGTGYGANEGITIAFGTNDNIRTPLYVDDHGWFNTSFVVDMQAFGTTTITASGNEAVA